MTSSPTDTRPSIDRLGEDTLDRSQAEATRDAYVELLDALHAAGLTSDAEVSVKLSAVGQALPGDGEKIALEGVRSICEKAAEVGTTVTLDMEDHTTTDITLGALRDLEGPREAARALVIERGGEERDAIRALDQEGERQAGDDAHPLAAPTLGLPADAHHGIALARRKRRDHGAGGGLASCIDVHVASLGDVAPALDGS
jgi:hypothetical protein